MGRTEAVVTIHGGMVRDERRKVEERFKQDKEVLVLIATDAAGEGINLQRAHLMINYDLPWNPNRLEQRFGRIHRIGQTEVCHLWNLVARETREGDVFQRLFGKLEEERKALGGKVFDILGKLTFENKPLRELLIEAIRYGNDPKVREKLNTVMDTSLNRENLEEILTERALTEDVMNPAMVSRIREDMERMEARKLQPFFIESFFLAAFKSLNGRIYKRDVGAKAAHPAPAPTLGHPWPSPGRYEITRVPFDIRNRDMQIGFGEPVLSRYERICFDKEQANIPGLVPAAFITPGHPLLSAMSDLVREKYGSDLKQGTIFVDDNDAGKEFRLLFYIENGIQDGQTVAGTGQRRVISKQVHFVEIGKNGKAVSAGFAPYLDYRAPNEKEKNLVLAAVQKADWLKDDVEDIAVSYAIQNIIPQHLSEVRDRKKVLLDKMKSAVKERLTSEIQYWDFRANELREATGITAHPAPPSALGHPWPSKESLGKRNAKLNADQASRRAEELTARLEKRLSEIAQERKITAMPPVVVGGALIVPKGWLVSKGKAEHDADAQGRSEIEKIAMQTVIAIERELGYEPRDVSAEKCGYDIESFMPESLRENGNCLRFIEVKGRRADTATVTVSKNEILAALNKPDEYILAIVMVDGDKIKTTYLQCPFTATPDFGAVSVNYKISDLLRKGKCVLERWWMMTCLIDKLRIRNFKKFDSLELENLSRVNLLVGDNNVGKTTALEAVFSFACGVNFSPLLSVPFFQRLQGSMLPNPMVLNPYRMTEYILYTFHHKNLVQSDTYNFEFQGRIRKKDNDKTTLEDIIIKHEFVPSRIFAEFTPQKNEMWYDSPTTFNKIDMQDANGNTMQLSLPNQYLGDWHITANYNQDKEEIFSVAYPNTIQDNRLIQPLALAKFNNELSHRDESEVRRIYAAITRAEIMTDFIKEINESFDIKIDAIENIPYPDGSESSITLRLQGKNSHIPLYAFGDGLRRWYSLLGGMLIFKNAVHCLDEIDAGFHQQVQGALSKQLLNYAKKYHNQLFMSTHNIEYMDTFLKAIHEMGTNILEKDIRVITLRSVGDSVKCRILTGVEALQAREDGVDVRL